MNYYLDTEFIEDGKTIDLISIGIIADDGRTLYHQNTECNFQRATDWVWRNVFPSLAHFDMRGKRGCHPLTETGDSGLSKSTLSICHSKVDDPCPWANRWEITKHITEFCDPEKHGKPEFWGYYADYDWVVFAQLFGPMIELPKGFPMYCRDLKQLSDHLGAPNFDSPKGEHNALVDAKWNRNLHEHLINFSKQ